MRIFKHDFITFGLAYNSQIMSRRCENQPDFFSYSCGEYTLKVQEHNIVHSLVRKACRVTLSVRLVIRIKHGLHMSAAPAVLLTSEGGWMVQGIWCRSQFLWSGEHPEITSVFVTSEWPMLLVSELRLKCTSAILTFHLQCVQYYSKTNSRFQYLRKIGTVITVSSRAEECSSCAACRPKETSTSPYQAWINEDLY